MQEFFRYPNTPHLVWLADGESRLDKVLSAVELDEFLHFPVSVEEKIDGANLGISFSWDCHLQIQNRGHYLTKPFDGQFARLEGWLRQRESLLQKHLTPELILFGEWCAAKHSLDYNFLPDWFLLFDVYDRQKQMFWSSIRRNVIAKSLNMVVVPELYRGRINLDNLKNMVAKHQSAYRHGPLEGVVIRYESPEWCESRAKLVQPEFSQSIGEHWKKRAIVWNSVSYLTSDAE